MYEIMKLRVAPSALLCVLSGKKEFNRKGRKAQKRDLQADSFSGIMQTIKTFSSHNKGVSPL